MSFRPVDQDARDRARFDHARSFVLEAGAGTGKTTLLVDRIESLVRVGTATLDEVAAVTFTENAATTLKLRLRERLERARADDDVPEDERQRAARALEVLERAPICTIHALSTTMLQERPIECGVSPGFRVADEAEADLLFAAAWEEWLADRLIHGDDVLAEALDGGIPLEGVSAWDERKSLRGFARTLLDQRDLEPLTSPIAVDLPAWKADLLEKGARAAALGSSAQDGDALAPRLLALGRFAESARPLSGRDLAAHLRRLEVIPRGHGWRPRWPSDEALEEGRRVAEWTRETSSSWKSALSASLHTQLVRALLGVADLYLEKKAARGVLDFLDLLLLARNALRDRESVRRYFRGRFRFLLIDEFQDTDPLQVEIAQLLAGHVPGDLVVVGDAKQSIYRFRRADVALFRRLSREAAGQEGRTVLHLTQNFRSRPAILRFVNRVFAGIIKESEEADQPAYEPIDPPPGLPDAPSVIALRFPAEMAESEDLLRAEASALVAWIGQAAGGGHEVRDPLTGQARPSRAGDVMVLARRLSQIRVLEEALEAAGLRFTVEGGKSFFDRQEVHEILSVLRAIEDPSDRVSLVAALRSSFCGVSDRDIVAYALSGGPLWMGSVDPGKPGAAALREPMELLDRLHRLRTTVSVPALLERLYEETRILAALTGTRRGEAQISNLEKVATLARQATDLGVLTLRGFASLLQERIDTAREEPDLPATRPGDTDTVRILTIHKAKGLEAPMVALYDTEDNFWIQTDVVPLWGLGRVAVGFREGCQPQGWEELREKDKAKAWAEARRLLYVACTRARDWLVIPSPPQSARVGAFWKELIAALPARSDADVQVVDAASLLVPSREEPSFDRDIDATEGTDAVAAGWDAARAALRETAARRPFLPVPATRAALAAAAPPVAPAGAGGSREFGRLVHRVLEWIPLEEPQRARAMAEALAPAFGLESDAVARAGEVAARALSLPIMQRARRAGRLWRELPLVFPEGDELVEGVVDLVFEEDGGLVVVDYKTDHITAEQALAQAAHHAPQLQLYGRGLVQATGRPVKERLVFFTAIGQTIAV